MSELPEKLIPRVIPPTKPDELLAKTQAAYWNLAALQAAYWNLAALHLAYIDMEDRYCLVRAKASLAEILERHDAGLGPCPWTSGPKAVGSAEGDPAE